jgi:putative two-component system response regulator
MRLQQRVGNKHFKRERALDNVQYPILIVDDNELNRDMLSRRLAAQGYRVETAADGFAALELVRRTNFGVILLDIMMPQMDGYEVLHNLKSDDALKHVPVIMITAVDDLDSTVRCLELGAEDYLPKPFNPVILRARVGTCLAKKQLHDQQEHHRTQLRDHNNQLEKRVRDQVREITSGQLATIFAMSKLADSRDPETGKHLERMREYCHTISRRLATKAPYHDVIDDEFVETIYAASPLHDIGKVGVPDHILLKPGKLSSDEWAVMQTHCELGAETLRAVHAQHPGNAFVRMGIDIAQSHHEKWDGSGYPLGLQGEEIPLAARILALGDVYDALTSKRCYKEAFSHEKSTAIIIEGRGSHFDPAVVDAFLESQEEFMRTREHFSDPEEQAA